MRRHPDRVGELAVPRIAKAAPVGQDDDRMRGVDGLVERRGKAPPVLVGVRIEPGVRHLVARQEVADRVAARRPSAAQQPQPLERRTVAGDPVREQVVDDRVELLLGRVPRLQQVLVELDLVDRRIATSVSA